jgi:hypothetical protein
VQHSNAALRGLDSADSAKIIEQRGGRHHQSVRRHLHRAPFWAAPPLAELAARRLSGPSAESATSPLPDGCREARDQGKADDGEYAGEDVSDKSLETITAEKITVKEEPAEQRGQRQGNPDEQPAACGAGPRRAGRVA